MRVIPAVGVAIALAAASGILVLAASPPYDLWPLAFVSWVPLLVAVHGRSPRAALLLGGVQGLVWNLGGNGWLPGVIRTFGELPPVATWAIALALFTYAAGRPATFMWLAARVERNGWPRLPSLALAFAATEALYPLLFPWYSAVQIQRVPALMQLAELGGPVLVGLFLLLVNVGAAEVAWAWLDGRPVARTRSRVALGGAVVMVLFGVGRMWAIDRRIAAAPALRVAMVQGNTPHEGTDLYTSAALYRGLTARLEREGKVDLVVWPETALNGVIPDDALGAKLRALTASPETGATLAAPIVTGTIVGRGASMTNSVALFAGGEVRGTYDKRYPLAFGEYVPFGDTFPALYGWIPHAGRLARGTRDDALPLGEHRISALICYEDILASETNRAVAHADPDLLVNVTNDAWFGDSTAAAAHLALAKFRAVEHRRYLVHASNGGVSAFVDPAGRESGRTPFLTEATAVETLRWMRARTLYEIAGDAPWWLAAAALLAMLFWPARAPSRVAADREDPRVGLRA